MKVPIRGKLEGGSRQVHVFTNSCKMSSYPWTGGKLHTPPGFSGVVKLFITD